MLEKGWARKAYVGLTATTGQLADNHDVLSLKALNEKLGEEELLAAGEELSDDELGHAVDSLVYTSKLEVVEPAILRVRGMGYVKEKMYTKAKDVAMEGIQHFTSSPCGVCPVADHCRIGATISPETCEYMDEWLSKF